MARCDDCMKNPVHPDKKCCFNCARVGTDCEVWHNFGEDCPGWESKVVTNADKIRAMTDAELAEFFSSLAYGRNTPWCEQFARKFCDNCPSEMYRIKETGQVLRLYECDFADAKCPHGSDIVWWLRQPAEETK